MRGTLACLDSLRYCMNYFLYDADYCRLNICSAAARAGGVLVKPEKTDPRSAQTKTITPPGKRCNGKHARGIASKPTTACDISHSPERKRTVALAYD